MTHRKRWLFDNLPPEAAEYQYDIFTKESQRRLAKRLGLSTAEVYLSKVPLSDAIEFIRRERLERFVLKPNLSRSSIGFRSLVREGNVYRDVRSGTVRPLETIELALRKETKSLEADDEWILEELLAPADGSTAPLDDFKFYCIGGRTELIYHGWRRVRPPKKWRSWYSRAWEPVQPSVKGPNQGVARAPIHGRQLLEVAELVSARLAYPFIRVDLYSTSRGVVLGEFTPGPGGRHNFVPEWDDRLTRRWLETARELEDGIRSGRIQPLTRDDAPPEMAAGGHR